MRTIFLVILLAGLAAAFGYPWAVTSFSGRELGVWRVYDRGGDFRPVTVRLEEADGPVRVLVDLEALSPPEFAPRVTTLTITADVGGRTVLAAPLSFAEAKPQERNPQQRDMLYRDEAGVISPVEEGEYTFVLGRGDAEGIQIGSVDLVLRGGVWSVDSRVQPIGYALSTIGFVGLVLALRCKRQSRGRSSEPSPPRWGRNGGPGQGPR